MGEIIKDHAAIKRPLIGLCGIALIAVLTALISAAGVSILAQKADAQTYYVTQCSDCHGNPPIDGTRTGTTGAVVGSHGKHATTYSYACTVCHIDNGTNLKHRNANIEMVSPLNAHSGSYSNPSGNTFPQTNTPTLYSCSNTYCHSTGIGGTAQAGESRSVAINTSPTWGNNGTITCNSCHGKESGNDGTGRPWYDSPTPKANSHKATKHASLTCDKCHYDTTHTGSSIFDPAKHADRQYEVVGTGTDPYTFSYSYNVSGGSCSTGYCHGSSAIQWGGALADTTECDSCHGGNKSASTAAPGGNGPMTTGKHTAHIANSDANLSTFACGRCHAGTVTTGNDRSVTGTKHVNAAKDVEYDTLNTGATANTCNTLYCHSDGKGGYNSYTLSTVWYGAATLDCKGCHGDNGTSSFGEPDYASVGVGQTTSNSHIKHVKSLVDCGKCHDDTTTTGNTITGTIHLDKSINVTIANAYDNTDTNKTNNYNATVGNKKCSNVYCHDPGNTGVVSPSWGGSLADTTECDSCHGGNKTSSTAAPGGSGPMTTGKHTAHLANADPELATFACGRCHTNTVTTGNDRTITGTAHANKSKDVNYDSLNPSATANTCSTVYCHSDGKGGYNSYTLSTAWYGATVLDCKGCHGDNGTSLFGEPDYASVGVGQTMSNSHPNHVTAATDCGKCHQNTSTTGTDITGTQHIDGGIDVDISTTYGGTYSVTGPPAKNCSSVACHGTGADAVAPQWGGDATCINCHQATTLGSLRRVVKGTGATNAGDFIRASRHVTNGTTTEIVTNFDCIVCHLEGDATSTSTDVKIDKNNHPLEPAATNTVHLRNVDNYTTGWAINKGTMAADSAPKVPTAASGTGWTTPTNVYASDAAYATHAGGSTTAYLCVSGFGLAVPAGTTITGVSVLLEGFGTSTTVAQRQIRVGLTKTGCTLSGTAKTAIQLQGTTSAADTELAIGYANDMWGNAAGSITVAEANASTFGVLIADNDTTTGQINIDRVRVVVHPTPRDSMDTFCLNCHDALGASTIAVNNANAGLLLNDTTTVRTVTGANNANPNSRTVNLRPFNTNDNLRNARDAASGPAASNMGIFRTSTYGRVLNVKDQFNSGNAAGKLWASHHNLNQFAKRYGSRNTTAWPNDAWNTYTTKLGQNIQTSGETAGLYCSDCHLNETNAHGSANAWYMLANETVATDPNGTSDVAPTGAANVDALPADKNVCYRCHVGTFYSVTGSTTPSATSGPRTNSHDDQCPRIDTGTPGTLTEYPFANQCHACHGGWSESNGGTVLSRGFGAIHGNNDTYNPQNGATTSKRYRFMSGAAMRFYTPDKTSGYNAETDWELGTGTVDCYTLATADTWSACTGHSGGGNTTTIQRARTLEY